MDDRIYRIAFSLVTGMKPAMSEELMRMVGGEKSFFDLEENQLAALIGRRLKIFGRAYRDQLLEKATAEDTFVSSNNITLRYISDDNYPQRLRECEDAPLILYSLGSADINAPIILSIVGTRHATVYGIKFTRNLIEELCDKLVEKPVIVSGLAFGIDIAAHKAALDCGAPTIGVLAHGLNTIYPAMHRATASEIATKGGLLVTEYPSSTAIHRGNFLARNRIVAGISDCTIVAESAAKGGAMVTARLAQGYNRDVFALPGRTSDIYSEGCNKLIQRNIAALVDDPDSIIKAMKWPQKPIEGDQKELPLDLEQGDSEIIDYLRAHGEGRLNTMAIAFNRPVARLMASLIELEFKGLVIPYPGGLYRLA